MNDNNSKKDRVIIMNTVLAYIQYGISNATPDNVLEVVCTHFTSTEITEAKYVLWNDCKLGNHPSRNNSKCRKAAEAHVQDIMDYMFKLDVENYVFSVEAGGIARLPKFNAESLNVVAINQQIVDLKEMCYTNKMVAASYRNDFLRCQDQLNIMQTVLQQHTNALRDIRQADGSFNINTAPHGTYKDVASMPSSNPKTVPKQQSNSNTSTASYAEVSKSKSPSKQSPVTTYTQLKLLTSSLSSTSFSFNADQSIPVVSNPRVSEVVGGPTGVPSQSSSSSTSTSPRIPSPSRGSDIVDGNDFQKNPRDIRNEKRRESHRRKVVYGTKNIGNSRFSGGQRDSTDLFVYHVNHKCTIRDLRDLLSENNINNRDVRIDITSHEASKFKSFRLIAPSHLKEMLLAPEFWSVGIRIKEYKPMVKGRDNNEQQTYYNNGR